MEAFMRRTSSTPDRGPLSPRRAARVDQLRGLAEVREQEAVHVIHGDCNQVLPEDIFPKVKYEDYRRARKEGTRVAVVKPRQPVSAAARSYAGRPTWPVGGTRCPI